MLRNFLASLVTLAWGLWFGGLMTLFLSVTTFFRHSRELAVQANPVLFAAFERYQLILAAGVLLLTFFWILLQPGRWKTALFILFALAALGAVVSSAWITPRINLLQSQHLTATAEFRKAHGQSMAIYSACAILLLLAGLILPILNRKDQPKVLNAPTEKVQP